MRLGSTKREVRSRAGSYHAIGRALLETAKALDVIADRSTGTGWASSPYTPRSRIRTRSRWRTAS